MCEVSLTSLINDVYTESLPNNLVLYSSHSE